jgi:hypothetical protein
MGLDNETIRKICDFVRLKPRTIQEISELIKKNWRTAERYVEKIEEETGSLSTRIFREGTRGALKVVYWNTIEDIHSTSFQAELFDSLMQGKRKQDFSPFDVYQYVDAKKKKAYAEEIKNDNQEDPDLCERTDFAGFLRQATKQVIIFSGNLSWINSMQGKTKIIDIIRELTQKGVIIKILARVSFVGADNIKKILELNKEPGRDMIEVRHRYQPLRAMIIDNKIVKLRERRDPSYYNPGELSKSIELFYDIFDKDWIEWLQKVFWKMFATAMPAEKRIKEIERIQSKII